MAILPVSFVWLWLFRFSPPLEPFVQDDIRFAIEGRSVGVMLALPCMDEIRGDGPAVTEVTGNSWSEAWDTSGPLQWLTGLLTPLAPLCPVEKGPLGVSVVRWITDLPRSILRCRYLGRKIGINSAATESAKTRDVQM